MEITVVIAMNTFRTEIPPVENRNVSIHDKLLSEIVCGPDYVKFVFKDGFDILEEDGEKSVPTGHIVFESSNSSSFSCYIVKRKPSPTGEKFCGREISLQKLNYMLKKGDYSIQVYTELYDYNHIFWCGELCPMRRTLFRRLPTVVAIDAMDFFPMVYSWE